jgi:hypothetical protein
VNDRFVIELPFRSVLANEWQRMHWTARRRYSQQVAALIMAAIPWKDRPKVPWKAWSILIERESTQRPDPSAIMSGAKPLIDALQPKSKRHPAGIGLVENDNADSLIAYHEKHIQGPRKWTRITIINEGAQDD